MKTTFGHLEMRWAPKKVRRNIPFYYNKTEAEFRADSYENYEENVVRQSLLHLADELWWNYPIQNIKDWVMQNLPESPNLQIAEIGCSVGRIIGDVAQKYPKSQCYGLDFSYQMLRQANDYWTKGKSLELDLTSRGFPVVKLQGRQLQNLNFALAKAEELPFEDESLDVVYSSFLIDRADNPEQVLSEMYRVLKKAGTMILLTPFNFQKKKHWEEFYPVRNFAGVMKSIGFQMIKKEEGILVKEYLDKNGNGVEWKVTAFLNSK